MIKLHLTNHISDILFPDPQQGPERTKKAITDRLKELGLYKPRKTYYTYEEFKPLLPGYFTKCYEWTKAEESEGGFEEGGFGVHFFIQYPTCESFVSKALELLESMHASKYNERFDEIFYLLYKPVYAMYEADDGYAGYGDCVCGGTGVLLFEGGEVEIDCLVCNS